MERKIANAIKDAGMLDRDTVRVTVAPYAYRELVTETLQVDKDTPAPMLFLYPEVEIVVDFEMAATDIRVEDD